MARTAEAVTVTIVQWSDENTPRVGRSRQRPVVFLPGRCPLPSTGRLLDRRAGLPLRHPANVRRAFVGF